MLMQEPGKWASNYLTSMANNHIQSQKFWQLFNDISWKAEEFINQLPLTYAICCICRICLISSIAVTLVARNELSTSSIHIITWISVTFLDIWGKDEMRKHGTTLWLKSSFFSWEWPNTYYKHGSKYNKSKHNVKKIRFTRVTNMNIVWTSTNKGLGLNTI